MHFISVRPLERQGSKEISSGSKIHLFCYLEVDAGGLLGVGTVSMLLAYICCVNSARYGYNHNTVKAPNNAHLPCMRHGAAHLTVHGS